MDSEYSIWQVARERDAMAWLKEHRPASIVMDLDLLGQSAHAILDHVHANSDGNYTLTIGICHSPETLSSILLNRLDQLIVNHSI